MPPEEVLAQLVRDPALYALAFVLGTLFGSFANVCIVRIPAGRSIVRPASHCGACGTPVRWYDNLPIVSYLVLRGRCRACGAGYSTRYLFVEALVGLVAVAVWHLAVELYRPHDPTPLRLARFAAYFLFAWTLVVIAAIDLEHKRIPDRITYPAIPFFLAVGLLLRDQPPLTLVVGVVVGYGIVRLISDGYFWLTGREGMGYGDGKLLALVGALLGWPAVLFSLFGGALLGSVIGVAALTLAQRRTPPTGGSHDHPPAEPAEPSAAGGDDDGGADDGEPVPLRHLEIPFGPFLVAAALVYLFIQDVVTVELALLPGRPPGPYDHPSADP